MTTRRRLAQLNDLTRLQRAECDRAALDHAAAAERAEAAGRAADRAAQAAAARADDWYAARTSGPFAPERDAIAAAALLQAEEVARDRADTSTAALAEREERAGHWHLVDARHRSSQRIARDARRALNRAGDEAQLDRIADRTLSLWRRP